MSRDEKEFELFQQMDKERNEVERIEERQKLIKSRQQKKKWHPNYNFRLIQEFEVPEWI